MRKEIMAVASSVLLAGALAATMGAGTASASVVNKGTYSSIRECAYAGQALNTTFFYCEELTPDGRAILFADDGTTDRAGK